MQDDITRTANQILVNNGLGITVDEATTPIENGVAAIAEDLAAIRLGRTTGDAKALENTLGMLGVQMGINAMGIAA